MTDQIRTTSLTTIRGHYLPLPVNGLEDPNVTHHLITLEGFTPTQQQCMIYAAHSDFPYYCFRSPPSYVICHSHFSLG